MSAPRSSFKTTNMIQDFCNWKSYSSLQKWLIVAAVTLFVSFFGSMWTVMFLFIVATAGGFKLSEEILHHERASHYAEQLFFKAESVYIEIKHQIQHWKVLMMGRQERRSESISSSQIINTLGVGYDTDGDIRQIDSTSSAKMSTALRMELNSIQLLIIRDFIRSWYVDISYDSQFLTETKYFLQQTFSDLTTHISQQDAKFLLTKIIQFYLFHFTMYLRAKNSFESHKIHPKTKVPQNAKFKRHLSIDAAFEMVTHLHSAMESEAAELSYLRGIVAIIILSSCNAEVMEGRCVRTLLVNILTEKVLLPVMKMMSNPDWLMEVIVLITSDEAVVGRGGDLSTVNGSNKEDEEKAIFAHNGSTYESQNLITEENTSFLNFHDCIADETPVQESLDASELDQTLCDKGDQTLCQQEFEHVPSIGLLKDTHTKTLLKNSLPYQHSAASLPGTPQEIQQTSTSSPLSGTAFEFSTTAEHPNIPSENLSCKEIKSVGALPTIDIGNESLENLSEREEQEGKACTFLVGEEDSDIFDNNPQAILSYGKRLSCTSTESDHSSLTVDSGEYRNSLSSTPNESDTIPETMSSSFPSLSSLKNFFSGAVKTGGNQPKKPKSLALFTEKISSNLIPKKSSKSNGENNNSQIQKPPQVLLDGVPVESPNTAVPKASPSPSTTSPHNHQPAVKSEVETTPSPGFFSSLNFPSFFSHTSPSTEFQPQTSVNESESTEDSPMVSPSPTSQGHNMFDGAVVIEGPEEYQSSGQGIFQDVAIPSTTIGKEYRSSAQYCLYHIEYEALYFNEGGKSVIRSGSVKRRHREFTSLQARLESHQTYKKFLKNIKGPKRWPTLPFKSLDKDTVEGRRLFLEKYLRDLIKIEAICNGPDLREFLAYEGDSHIAFVKKSPDISVPRFDKMFMRGVTEVVDRIKALPNIPQEVMSGLRGRESSEEKSSRSQAQLDADMIDVCTSYESSGISETGNILYESSLRVMHDFDTDDDKELFDDVITDPRNVEQENELYKHEVEKVVQSLPRFESNESESPDLASTSPPGDLDLSFAVLDLLVQGLRNRDHWMCRDRVVKSMQSVLGKALNRYLESSIAELVTDAQLTHYLRLLRETIWPQGQLWSDSRLPKTEEQRAATREQAKRCLTNFFPESVRLVVGHKDFEDMINHFLTSLESEHLNRHLLYTILDMLIEQLFPGVIGHEFLEDLLYFRSNNSKTV